MPQPLNHQALSATLHCLLGCGIGEVLGMIISSALGWDAAPSVALAVTLAFFFGYALTILPLLRAGITRGRALRLAFVADTASIATMELVDNLFILAVPGAIHASLASWLFWWSLAMALFVAFLAAYPLNRWLIGRGQGHAAVHHHHHMHH